VTARVLGQPVSWYWIPVERETLAALSRKSNLLGALQTGGFLTTLALTGSLAWYSAGRWPWFVTLAALFLHGTAWAFLANGLHEFSHGTVFAAPGLNRFFLGIFGFLKWINPVLFWTIHGEHHKFTMYPEDEFEAASFRALTLRGYLAVAFVNLEGLHWSITTNVRHAFGRFDQAWEARLFPASKPELRGQVARWSRLYLVGHATILIVAAYFQLWMLPVVISLPAFYGGALQWLCNQAQHAGLPGNVPDFRLCSRTVYLNRFLEFMYWHMNYHTDHHLYAGVPCYRLAQLHRVLKADMPDCPRGLIATWRGINAIFRKQKSDPRYQYYAPVPPMRGRSPSVTRGSASTVAAAV